VKAKELFPDVFSRHAEAYRRRQEQLLRHGDHPGRLQLIDWIAPVPGEEVLDLACGPGTLTFRLAERVAPEGEAVGIDLAPRMIEVAQAAAPPGLPLRFELMDMEDLRFPDASFDAATCGHGLQFCPDLHQALTEARRVVRQGGRLAASVPAGRYGRVHEIMERITAGRLPPAPNAPDRAASQRTTQDPKALQAAAEDAGFEDVRIARIEERHHWNSPADYVGMADTWWVLASRLDQVTPAERDLVLRDAQAAIESELGPGPVEVRADVILLFART
jgi:ubiquinone/menaquinone biosynthesis C-methylase UbiE